MDPGPTVPPREMELMSAVCPHGMTQLDPTVTFVIPDASQDWRFAHNVRLIPLDRHRRLSRLQLADRLLQPLTLSGTLAFCKSRLILQD